MRLAESVGVLLSLAISHSTAVAKVFKCCPIGTDLGIIIENNNGASGITEKINYECMSRDENATQFDLFGYNFESDDAVHLPQCSDGILTDFEIEFNEFYLPPKACIDTIRDHVFAVVCFGAIAVGEVNQRVLKLRKCCGEDESYDAELLECFKAPPKLDHLVAAFLNQTVAVLVPGAPNCSDNEVVVEYYGRSHDISLNGNELQIVPYSKHETVQKLSANAYCFDRTFSMQNAQNEVAANAGWIARTCKPKKICNRIPCVRRCCRDGQKLVKRNGKSDCAPHPVGLRPIFHNLKNMSVVLNPEFGFLQGQDCERYVLMPEIDDEDVHYLSHTDGKLHIEIIEEPFSNDHYCIEWAETKTKVEMKTFVCFEEPKTRHRIDAIGLTISCVFLAFTLLVYACLPKLLNLHGKTLVSHVISLLAAYAALAYVRYEVEQEPILCYAAALMIYGSFLAAFSWLNIMCFDIWWTFGTVRATRGIKKSHVTRRFIFYSIYAWGIPLAMTNLAYFADKYEFIPDKLKPNLGKGTCWFNANKPGHLLFFIIPIAIQNLLNSLLFILTLIHCNRVKSEIFKMQNNDGKEFKKKRFIADRARFVMNIKLFIVMGVSWLLEVIATIFREPEELWYISDAFNVLQGVLVFLIFVFKRKVYVAMKRRLGFKIKPRRGAAGITNTTGTTSPTTGTCVDPFSKRVGKSAKSLSPSI